MQSECKKEGGGEVIGRFSLSWLRGSAKSIEYESKPRRATGEIILEVEVSASVDLILKSIRAIPILHNIVMDVMAGTSESMGKEQKKKAQRGFLEEPEIELTSKNPRYSMLLDFISIQEKVR